MNIYLEKALGFLLMIIGIYYVRNLYVNSSSMSQRVKGHGYIAGVLLTLFGIILLFGLRGSLKNHHPHRHRYHRLKPVVQIFSPAINNKNKNPCFYEDRDFYFKKLVSKKFPFEKVTQNVCQNFRLQKK